MCMFEQGVGSSVRSQLRPVLGLTPFSTYHHANIQLEPAMQRIRGSLAAP